MVSQMEPRAPTAATTGRGLQPLQDLCPAHLCIWGHSTDRNLSIRPPWAQRPLRTPPCQDGLESRGVLTLPLRQPPRPPTKWNPKSSLRTRRHALPSHPDLTGARNQGSAARMGLQGRSPPRCSCFHHLRGHSLGSLPTPAGSVRAAASPMLLLSLLGSALFTPLHARLAPAGWGAAP